MYDTATGERLVAVSESMPLFSPDGELTAASSVALGTPCAVWSPADYPWLYRSGLIATDGSIPVYGAPSADAAVLVEGYQGELIVFARTVDDEWYKVMDDDMNAGWVSTEDIEVISMPEGVPVENP